MNKFPRFILVSVIIVCMATFVMTRSQAAELKAERLRCEYRENPQGIDASRPRLSWVLQSADRGQCQTAYQVLVASSPKLLASDQGNLWDTGRVASDQSVQVEYAGKSLASRTQCHWKVRVWDKDGVVSPWSRPASWAMGLLDPQDWQASWIKPVDAVSKEKQCLDACSWIWLPQNVAIDQIPPGVAYFRARLKLPSNVGVRHASVLMSADNYFQLSINGKEAMKGDDWHSPQKAEITKFVKAGENVFAVEATNSGSSPNPAGMIGHVLVELTDGRQVTLATDAAWKTNDRAAKGWQDIGFDDAGWADAKEVAKFGGGPWGNTAQPENPPSHWVRKVFSINAAPEQAVAYVNVMGYYELYVNGQKVGDDVLSPAVSDYTMRSLYRTYDISKLLGPGRNCVGLWLAPGWHQPKPIARAQIELSVGGKPMRVVTDDTWTCAPSTRTQLGGWAWSNMGGERVDARLDIADWSKAECTTGKWTPVLIEPASKGKVLAQSCPPNRIGQVIPLATCTALNANTWELDFGTNLTGWLRLRMPPLAAGQRVVMRYADKRYQTPAGDDTPAGKIRATSQFTVKSSRGPLSYQTFNQIDEFISAGKSSEQFCSKFNYHGFRYVIVEGLPAKPAPGDAEALLIESALEPAGTFECSNKLFNRIHQTNLWTLRCLDLGGYVVDCPHRERLGYGDGQISIESLAMNCDAAAIYGKWAGDWFDAQNPTTGEFPHIAPSWYQAGGGPGWGGVGCVLPWKLYLFYGDRRLLERGYEPMRRHAEFIEHQCKDGVLRSFGTEWDFIGDWVAPGRGMDTNNWPSKPAAELFNNCYRIYLWDQVARVADILGRSEEAKQYRAKIAEIRPLVHAAFYDAKSQLYVLDEQSYQLMPLMTGVVPKDLRETILKKLEKGILVKNKGHLDTGMLGTYFLIQYLQATGRNDLLYTIYNQETYPSWGYMLSQGATTFWEQWNGYFSQIHSCFASPDGWFYQGLAGIRPDPSAPGFKKIVIKPAIVGDLTWVKCGYDSMHGRIESDWRREGDRLTMDIKIPANTTATVYVPTQDASKVLESGEPANKVKSVTFVKSENGAAIYQVGSGNYSFTSPLETGLPKE